MMRIKFGLISGLIFGVGLIQNSFFILLGFIEIEIIKKRKQI